MNNNLIVPYDKAIMFWRGKAIPVLALRLVHDHQETPKGKVSDLKMDDWELAFTVHFAGGEATDER